MGLQRPLFATMEPDRVGLLTVEGKVPRFEGPKDVGPQTGNTRETCTNGSRKFEKEEYSQMYRSC